MQKNILSLSLSQCVRGSSPSLSLSQASAQTQILLLVTVVQKWICGYASLQSEDSRWFKCSRLWEIWEKRASNTDWEMQFSADWLVGHLFLSDVLYLYLQLRDEKLSQLNFTDMS